MASVLGSPLMRRRRGLAGKIHWHINKHIVRRPWLLNLARMRLTVVDAYGAPGDTLLTAIVCRHLHERYPRLRLNCLTATPELLRDDPNLATLNEPETFFSVWSWYPETVARRDRSMNVLRETFDRLGLGDAKYDYRARVYLTDEERADARGLIGHTSLPIMTFNMRSKEEVKDWPVDRWRSLLNTLKSRFRLVQLGDDREPEMPDVLRLAGRLTLRRSMSVLAHAALHIGPDSFLMHAANGLAVPAVIVFGGSRTPESLGYSENINLYSAQPCSPCWIHSVDGESCRYNLACMDAISAADVVSAVDRLMAGRTAPC